MRDDAERLIAWLRIVAIPVLLLGHGLITETSPSHRAFVFAVVAFSVYAVLALIGATVREVPPRVATLLAALDIGFAAGSPSRAAAASRRSASRSCSCRSRRRSVAARA